MRTPRWLPTAVIATAICMTTPAETRAQGAPRAEPFTIAVSDAALADLRERLARTRWPDQLPNTDWSYGTDTAYLRGLISYWQRDFDWRAQEKRLNSFHQYRASIDGMRIHFIHERSRDPNATPLLLLHGWPSSFVQMLDLVPLLTDPASHGMPGAPSFHVVVASLPGFGFSDVPTRTGVGFATAAAQMATLMTYVLGYSRYGVRGSDLGGVIARQMALAHPDNVIGVHLTGIIGSAGGQPPFTAAEQKFLDATRNVEGELAYARLQMSKPQTLAMSLMDSPAGLAAWIVEKFRAWSDSHGDVESRFSKDELLTNLMVYWASGTAPSSVRIYYEFVREPLLPGRVETPVGMLMTTKDLFPAAPREWGERFLNVTRWVETDSGGHFLEWEEPEIVARDLQAFFSSLR
jgi:pimeloyl-ACP methyl ester carboxylesterase